MLGITYKAPWEKVRRAGAHFGPSRIPSSYTLGEWIEISSLISAGYGCDSLGDRSGTTVIRARFRAVSGQWRISSGMHLKSTPEPSVAAWKNAFEVPPRAVRRILEKVLDGPSPSRQEYLGKPVHQPFPAIQMQPMSPGGKRWIGC